MPNIPLLATGGNTSQIESSLVNTYNDLHSRTEEINVPNSLATSLSSSPRGTIDTGSLSSSRRSSPVAPIQTAAERAREKRLKEDPMAKLVGPLFVDCRRCGNRIKLSPKSTFDPFHWKTHRERCLKKPPGPRNVKKPKIKGTSTSITAPTSTASPEMGAVSLTPPLTPDKSDEMCIDDSIKEESFPPPSPPPKDLTAMRPSEAAFEEYLLRSHRKPPRVSPHGPQEHWQDWSWSQLKAPSFVSNSTSPHNDNDIMDTEELKLRNDAIISLTLLSKST